MRRGPFAASLVLVMSVAVLGACNSPSPANRTNNAGGTSGAGGTGGAGGMADPVNDVGCHLPYLEPAMKTCGNNCMRCSGGDPTIEKLLALTPPNGKTKLSGDYALDSESDDPDTTP